MFNKRYSINKQWHHLEVVAVKNNFEAYLDGKKIEAAVDNKLTGRDRAFLEGAFAFETSDNENEFYIDDVEVELLSEQDIPLGIIRIYPKGNDALVIRGLREQAVGGEGRAAEDAHKLGANYISINYNLVADPESFSLEPQVDLELLHSVIKSAHLRGLKVIGVVYLWLKDPNPEVCWSYQFVNLPDDKIDVFVENYKKELFSLAESAEKNGIDILVLGDRLEDVVGADKVNDLLREILPRLKEVYSGKLIAGTNYWDRDIPLGTEINQNGFDFITLNTGPEDNYEKNLKNYEEYKKAGERLKDKYNKPLIAPWVDYSANSLDFLEQEQNNGRNFAQVKAKMYEDFYLATNDVFDGYIFARVFERANNKLVTVTTEEGEEFIYGYMGPETEEKIKEIFTIQP
ncbi:MAG: hypothetical protein ACTSWZ_06020 [Candidatus Heimdallarchaeaceae archaeon]